MGNTKEVLIAMHFGGRSPVSPTAEGMSFALQPDPVETGPTRPPSFVAGAPPPHHP